MSGSNGNPAGQIGVTLLTITFVVLKPTHVIDWSWWWILSPLWIVVVLSLVIVTLAVVAARKESKTTRGKLNAYERSLRRRD